MISNTSNFSTAHNNTNSILQAVINTNTNKQKDPKKETISEQIECKSILSSATLNSKDSSFSYKKQGKIQIIKNWHRRSYSIEFYLNNKNVASFDISYESVYVYKNETLSITVKDLKSGELCNIGFEKSDIFKQLENIFNLIKNERDDNFMCTQFNQSSSSSSLIKTSEKKLQQTDTNKSNQQADQTNEIQSNQKLTNNISTSFYSNKPAQLVPQSSNQNRMHITENVLKMLAEQPGPIVVNRNPLGQISSPNQTNLFKRKREDSDYNLNALSTNNNQNNKSTTTTATTTTPPTTPINNNTKKANFEFRKKNLYDFDDQENKVVRRIPSGSQIKTWNRTNSNIQCGKGFSNLGNTCYMNAILQCLLNIDLFSSELLSVENFNRQKLSINMKSTDNKKDDLDHDESLFQFSSQLDDFVSTNTILTSDEKSLFQCMCELLRAREQHNESQQLKSLKEIKNAISKEATIFLGYQQHDAHEFLCQVLDQLKDDIDKLLKTEVKQNTMTTRRIETSHTNLTSEINTSNSIRANIQSNINNPVVQNFQFEVKHTIHCLKCDHEQSSIEEYNNLCLEMPLKTNQNISLQDTLEIFFKDEYLNDFKCDNCKTIEQVVIKRRFNKSPRILILHLKRYQFQEIQSDSSDNTESTKQAPQFKLIKNDSDIKIPLNLSLHSVLNSEPKQEQNKTTKTASNKEELKKSKKQETINSRLKISSNFKIPKKNESNNASKMLEKPEDFNDFELPNLNLDQNKFLSLDLTEDEQMRQALELSLMEHEQQQHQKLMFVDGSNNSNYFDDNQEDDPIKDKDFTFYSNKRSDLRTYESKKKPFAQLNNIDNNKNTSRVSKININNNNNKSSKQQTNQQEIYDMIRQEEEDKQFKKAIAESLRLDKEQSKHTESIEDPFKTDILNEYKTIHKNNESKTLAATTIKLEEEKKTLVNDDSNLSDLNDANMYRIIGIVNHLGVSSNSGHYISDVYNLKTKQWSSYDDTKVEHVSQDYILNKRTNTGYIFFYIKNSLDSNK